MTDKPLEFADDHVVENKTPPPLKVSKKNVPVRPVVNAILAEAMAAMYAYPKNERVAKAGKLENSALEIERLAPSDDAERDLILLTVHKLRLAAATLRE